MHLQIEFILEVSGYLDLQRHGFKWNLHYNERVYPVVLHPYIPFIIGDTEGHDRLCGHYTARFEKVKQLCRVCECPTRLSGYSKAKFNHRKPAAINRLIAGANSAVSQVGATANLNALKDMSQNYLRNGFGRARFGSHNERGILAHALVRCCTLTYSRPRRSPQEGDGEAHEGEPHEAQGEEGGEPEGKAKKKKAKSKATKSIPTHPDHNLRFECHVSDWILAVSSLLQWHQWMKQPEMPRHQVVKSKYAVQWLMRNVANICPRQTGMGNNTIKNHLVLHICEDILDHGVPENVNSAYAESAHIPLSKMTARNTQKRVKTFTKQAAERYVENLAISSAVYDMECDHASMARGRSAAAEDSNTSADKWKLGGRRFTISWPLGDARPSFQWFRKYPGDHPHGDSCREGNALPCNVLFAPYRDGSFVAQSSSPLRDTNTGPIQHL
ncbi:hypothetical protein MHU86_15095 [Fragilaria crotonensis]|nr:hypothetical protein MHU86_15095 [Fragilaria crotonensis]